MYATYQHLQPDTAEAVRSPYHEKTSKKAKGGKLFPLFFALELQYVRY